MVAQTKADVRNFADKPVPSGKKEGQQAALVDGKELLDDQAAAAAVVDAEQAEAVAAQVAADGGIMPTEAPMPSIGEVAQATTPTTTDTTTTTATTPPPVEAGAAPLSPWAIGGIAVLGVGAIALASNSGDDSPAPVPPPVAGPPASPPPGGTPTPANVAPTSADSTVVTDADGSTNIAVGNFPFFDADTGDVRSAIKIGTVTPGTPIDVSADPLLAFDTTTGHGYQLVTTSGTWAQANAAALANGGHLAILNSVEEAAFINANFALGDGAPQSDGTWVGLSQAVTDPLARDTGWSWVDGTALPVGSAFWADDAPADFIANPDTFQVEDGEAQFGAIFETFDTPGTSATDIMYDFGVESDTVVQYLVEYDSPLTLNGFAVAPGTQLEESQLANLQWNSMFTTGGSLTFAVADDDRAYSSPENTMTFSAPVAASTTTVSTMIDDQHLNVLA